MKYLLLLLTVTHLVANSIAYQCNSTEEIEVITLQASAGTTRTTITLDGDPQVVELHIDTIVRDIEFLNFEGYQHVTFESCYPISLLFEGQYNKHTCLDNNDDPLVLEYTSPTSVTVLYRGTYFLVEHTLEHLVIDGYTVELGEYGQVEYQECYNSDLWTYYEYLDGCDLESATCNYVHTH